MLAEAAASVLADSISSTGDTSRRELAQKNSTYLPQIASINEVWNIGRGSVDSEQKNPISIPSQPVTGIPKQNLQYQYPVNVEGISSETFYDYLPILGLVLAAIFLLKRI